MKPAAGIQSVAEAGTIGARAHTAAQPGPAARKDGSAVSAGNSQPADAVQARGCWQELLASLGLAEKPELQKTPQAGTAGQVAENSSDLATAIKEHLTEGAASTQPGWGPKQHGRAAAHVSLSTGKASGEKRSQVQAGGEIEIARDGRAGASKTKSGDAGPDAGIPAMAAASVVGPAPANAPAHEMSALRGAHNVRVELIVGEDEAHNPMPVQAGPDLHAVAPRDEGIGNALPQENGDTDVPAEMLGPDVLIPSVPHAKSPMEAPHHEPVKTDRADSSPDLPGSKVPVSEQPDLALRASYRVTDPGIENAARTSHNVSPGSTPTGANPPAKNAKPSTGAVQERISASHTDPIGMASLNASLLRVPGEFADRAERQISNFPTGSGAGSDPFLTMDTNRNPPTTWIHVGTHKAEAGYLDPALGWIGVRADAATGNVHAALVPSSAEAAQVLAGNLAGLNTYLSEHHGQSATVTVAPQDSGAGAAMGNQAGNHPSPGEEDARPHSREQTPAVAVAEDITRAVSTAREAPSVPMRNGAGRYISLMA